MKRILTLVFVISVLFAISVSVYAIDVPQAREDCSIEVIVRYKGKNVDSGTLTAIKVGYVNEDDGDYFFSQEKTGLLLDDIASAGSAAVQQKFYDENKGSYTFYKQTQSVKEGKAVFSDLPTGLYLIIQEKAADGFNRMASFLVSIPYMKNGTYQYHVTAAIKSELVRPDPEPTKPSPTKPDDSKLPQTGQLQWPIPLMVITGLTLFTIGWKLRFGKKSDFYEE